MCLRGCGSALLLVFIVFFQGCASQNAMWGVTSDSDIELTGVPFFPQETNQCGPASLATLLTFSGLDVTPKELRHFTYIPAVEGSLQPELMAAARHFGRIPYRIDPTPQALIDELRLQHPVLVLQNYGLESLPFYHYAVVIGVDLAGNVILRSGTTKRLEMSSSSFMMSWKRPGSWGIVVLKPGELPAASSPDRYISEVSAFEKTGRKAEATIAYEKAFDLWPSDDLVLFALANNLFSRERYTEAEDLYLQLLTLYPNHIAALNNLAELLARRGCHANASRVISRAIVAARQSDSPFLNELVATREEILHEQKEYSEKSTVKAGLPVPDELNECALISEVE